MNFLMSIVSNIFYHTCLIAVCLFLAAIIIIITPLVILLDLVSPTKGQTHYPQFVGYEGNNKI